MVMIRSTLIIYIGEVVIIKQYLTPKHILYIREVKAGGDSGSNNKRVTRATEPYLIYIGEIKTTAIMVTTTTTTTYIIFI